MRETPPSTNAFKKKFSLSVNTTDSLSAKLAKLHFSVEDLQEEQKEIMSKILPYLFLGSENIPLNSPIALKQHGITHVLNMAQELLDSSPSRVQDDVIYSTFPLEDVPDSDLVPTLHRVADYIQTARNENAESKFLVHCKAGKSRSASAVIAYMILKLGMEYAQAFEAVKTARPSIDPNIGFIVVLSGLIPGLAVRNKSE